MSKIYYAKVPTEGDNFMNYKSLIAKTLMPYVNLSEAEIAALLENPPKADLGDSAFPCFNLAKIQHKSPVAIAQ